MNKFKILTVILLSFILISCDKTEDQATGAGDAIIFAKKSGTNTVYGLLLYAYTFSEFQNVKVTLASDPTKSYSLKANQGYKTTFTFETPESELSATKPLAGTYNFTAIFENGAGDEFQDVLSDKSLAVPTINKGEYNSSKSLLEIEWASLADASVYSIHIMDGTKQVFGSNELGSLVKSYAISANGGGWAAGFSPESGKTYTIRLFAYLFESEGNTYNLQASAMAEKEFIWGSAL